MASIPKEQSVSLQLGDIIEISSPSDDKLNAKQFFIKYLDKERIEIIENCSRILTNLNDFLSFEHKGIEVGKITASFYLHRHINFSSFVHNHTPLSSKHII